MEKYFMAAINAADKIGSQRTIKLKKIFGSAEAVWKAEREEVEKINFPSSVIESFLKFREQFPHAPENLKEFCATKNFNLCCIDDEDYPPILKEISSPPAVFYYRGELKSFAERIAIVGTRNYTDYGKKIATTLGEELAATGLTVVSGAARGIDTFAHRGALKVGRTVAVLGCGISVAFKSAEKNFFEEISERGLVMSEFPPNLRPDHTTFPPRNRIIAGLSRGIIVVEAGKKSGALITSTYAGEFGRDVFAVPGNIFSPMSVGCHDLIRDGAILIKNAQDVLEQYDFNFEKVLPTEKILTEKPIELEGAEKKIFDVIPSDDFITLDEILGNVDDVAISEISSIILQLEIKKCIVEDGGRYKRT